MWESRREEMKKLAGTMTEKEMAAYYGVTRGCLSYYAARFKISLKSQKLPDNLKAKVIEE